MTTCPKCGYVRKPSESAPDWQCPACGIAYAKFHTAPPPAAAATPAATPADAPASAALVGAEASDGEGKRRVYEFQVTSPIPGAIFGIGVMIPGVFFLLRGLDVIHTAGRPEYTDPGFVTLGATLCGAGYWFVVVALDLSKRTTRIHGHAVWLFLAWVYTWAVFTTGFEALTFTSIGPMSGIQFWRAVCVAFDLYVAISIFDNMLEELSSAPPAKRNKLAYAAGCIVVAFTLELTGGLAKIYAGLGLKLPGPVATIGLLQSWTKNSSMPAMPLEDYAGTWIAFRKGLPGIPHWDRTGWISRAEVSVANGNASARFWRSCPQQECEVGSFPGSIESRRSGQVVAVHFTGKSGGIDWLVTLSPQQKDLMMEEQHVRGKDMNTYHQWFDVLRRPKE